MTKRKSFSPEFKREAVRLLETAQKSSADLARELGVRRNQLYKWKEHLNRRGAGAFPHQGEDQAAMMRWLDCARSWKKSKRSATS
jgi:transposase-like protein